jgi:Transposase DDE domain group 1
MSVMVDLYCASYSTPPDAVTLDIDDTVDMVHGHQQLSLFNARNGFARSSCLRGSLFRRRIDPATCHHDGPRRTMTTRAVGALSNQSDQPSARSQSLIKPRRKRPNRNACLPQINRQNQLLGE